MNTKERILQFLEYKKISKRKFYLKTGLSNGFLDKVANIGSDKIEIILSNYPEINSKWLISGVGNMVIPRIFPDVSIEEEIKMMDEIEADINLLTKLIKTNKDVNDIEQSYKDILITVELIGSYLDNYDIRNQMNKISSQYRLKKISISEVKEEFKVKFAIVKEMYAILKPYKMILEELYGKLYDFDMNHDRIYLMEE